MAKIEKRVQFLTEGINANVADSMMEQGELLHSTNTDSGKIGLLTKCAGQTEYWDIGATSVSQIAQAGADVYAIMNSALYKKGTVSAVVSSLLSTSPLFYANDDVFYIKSTGAIGAWDGSAESTKNLINAPSAISDLFFSGNKVYAVSGGKAYVSTPPRRLVGTVVSDHAASATTVNVSSTRFIRVGNVLEFWSIGATAKKQLLTVLSVPSATTFTCAALAMTSAITFTGAGLDDETVTGSAYTGTTRRFYEVEILTTAASPDTFRWRVDGGSWSSGLPVATTDTTLELGVKIKWAAVDGHTIGNKWSWYQTPGTLTSGDEIYYENYKTTDIFMWNDDPNVGSWFEIESDSGAYQGAVEQLGTALFFFPNEVKRFDGSTLSSIAKIGTTLPKTIASVGKAIFFANSRGIYRTDGNNVQRVSQKMDPYFDGLSSYTGMCAGADDNYYRLFIGTTSHESLTGTEIVLDTSSMKFETRTGIDATAYSELVVSNEHRCYLGTSGGSVMKVGTGTSNNGVDIPFSAKTKYDDLDKPNDIKQGDRVVFKTEPGTVLNVYYSINRGEYKALGQIDQEVQAFGISNLSFYNISFLMAEGSSDVFPGIYEYTIYANIDEPITGDPNVNI